MKCPRCLSQLEIEDICEGKKSDVTAGFVRCECNRFPILKGILILRLDYVRKSLVRLLKEGKLERAVALAQLKYADIVCGITGHIESRGVCGRASAKILTSLVMSKAKYDQRKYSDEELPFCDLLGNTPFETYLRHRFSTDSFCSLYPFLPLIKKKREMVLDLGCGTGHVSSVISTCVKPQQLVCADSEFTSLCLAKRYFAPDAQYVCLDANYTLPFNDATFTSIFMLDAFHYVRALSSLANEMERILTSQGLLLLLHLHSSLSSHDPASNRLPPLRWLNLFRQLPVRALPEERLVDDFILRDKLDLAREYSQTELNSSNVVAIVGSRNGSLFTMYEGVANELVSCKNNLVINPIYEIKREQNKVVLRRRARESLKGLDYPLTVSEKRLPKECILGSKFAHIVRGRALDVTLTELSKEDWSYIEQLMKMCVVINVPKRYC